MRLVAMYLIFIIIMLGYISWLCVELKVNIYLTPGITVTGIAAAMCLSGMLNVMTAAHFAVSALGAALFIRYFFRVPWQMILKKEWFSLLIAALVLGYIIYYLKGGIYADGDTMTHWALIAREMCETNRLPNFTTQVVTYQSYPPATACWIWFMARITGFTEAKSLLAQAGWLFTLALSVFSLNRGSSKAYSIAAGLFSLLLMFFGVGLDNLRVDTILPSVFLGGVVLCFAEHENKNLPFLLAPFLIAVTMTKNSGILFAVYLAIVFAFLPVKGGSARLTRPKRLLYAIGVSVGTFYLWKKHTDMVYLEPGNTRHAVSISAMQSIFGDRTTEDIREIMATFLKRWFSLNESAEWVGLLVFFIIFLLALRVIRKEALLTAAGVFAGYIIYKALLLAMYLFNMPGDGAKNVAAYARYQGTYTVVILFASLYLFAFLAREIKGKIPMLAALTGIVLVFTAYAAAVNFPKSAARPDYESGGCHRKLISLMKKGDELQVGQRVLVYTHITYSWYYTRYTFHNQRSFGTDDLEKLRVALTDNPEGFERIVILDHDENVDQLLNEFGYGAPAGEVIIKL